MKAWRRLLALSCGLLIAGAGLAQDSHYWTSQYGNQARLLGGTVVGTSADVAAVYYNPGRLALVEDPQLLLAGTAYEYTTITLTRAGGEGVDLNSSRLGNAPSLFAGEVPFGGSQDHRLAYSFLTRHNFELRSEEWFPVAGYPDVERFDANIDFAEKMSEYWGGITWAHRWTDHIGIGVSGFVSVRDQSSKLQTLAQLENPDNAGLAVQRSQFDYLQVGVLAKIGIGADFGAWQAGLAVTTPVLGVYGQGNIGYVESLVSQTDGEGGPGLSRIVNDYQQDRSAEYRSPLSTALGAGYTWGDTKLHLSAEYFAAVSGYMVMTADPITVPDTGEVRDESVADHREAVLNFGLGLEHAFGSRVRGYASFRTDRSAATPEAVRSLSLSLWDIRHLAAGVTFPVAKSTFTVGGIYAYGSEIMEREVTILPPAEGEDEASMIIDGKYRRLTFVLGFAIGL